MTDKTRSTRSRTRDVQQQAGGSIGPATDAQNTPVIDPTENVLQLVDAAVQRQDDLRQQESAHLRELMSLRAQHDQQMREKETERIDSIRAVDVQAVQRSAEVQVTQATALATQVSVSAETLRTQVAAAASAAAVSLAAALVPIQEAIADLRRAQYEQQGQKAAVVETKTDTSRVMAFVFGGFGMFVGIIAIVFAIVQAVKP